MSNLSILSIRTKLDVNALYCMKQSSYRSSGPGLHDFFAKWLIFESKRTKTDIEFIIAVYSKFPEAWKIGAVMLGLPLVITGLLYTKYMIPGLVILSLSFLASSYFRYLTLKISLRRYGYKGKIRKVDHDEYIFRLLEKKRDRWLKQI